MAGLLVSVVPVTHAGDTLKFRNGDRLQGSLLSATATDLRWQADGAPVPIQFEPTQLAELQLAPRPPRTARQWHGWAIELTNGDKLAGDIVTLDDQTLTLQTWYAGKLVLKRGAVKRIESRAQLPTVIYSGPTGASDWKSVQPGWTYKRGKLECRQGQYSLSVNDVGFPDRASIEFDIAWRGQPYWAVGFYAAPGFQSGLTGYQLTCSGNSLYLQRTDGGNQRNLDGNVQVAEPNLQTKAHYTIRVNKSKKTIAVSIDGVLVKQWTDAEEFAGKGTALYFQSQGQSDLRLANILVTEWDGRLDSEPAARAPTEDLVRLRNGDKVSGVIRAITGGAVTLTNSFAAVKIPLPTISVIDLAGPPALTARRQVADVRVFFPDRTQFTLALEQLDDKTLTGTTENSGRVTLPLDALTRLRFHIDDPVADSDEDEDWGVAPIHPNRNQRVRIRK